MLLGKQSISIQLQTMTNGSNYPKFLIGNWEPSIILSQENQSHQTSLTSFVMDFRNQHRWLANHIQTKYAHSRAA
jgi:hypothetical protein